MSQRKNSFETGNWIAVIVGFLLLVMIFVGLTRIAWWGYRMLWYIALPLLAISAIVDYKMIRSHFTWVFDWVKKLYHRSEILGVVAGIFSLIGFPISVAMLAIRAFTKWNTKREMQKEQPEAFQTPEIGEYIDFEEVQEKRRKTQQRRISNNEYDDLFDN